MGRIYIILGEPNTIEKFENLTNIFPTHIWFYDGKIEYGLPNAFNVVFFKPAGAAEWKLYTPAQVRPPVPAHPVRRRPDELRLGLTSS